MSRFLFVLALALVLHSVAFGQPPCQNGQCQVPGRTVVIPQFGLAVPAGDRVEVRNVVGRGPTRVLLGENGAPDVFLDEPRAAAPVASGGCPGGVCPIPQKKFIR